MAEYSPVTECEPVMEMIDGPTEDQVRSFIDKFDATKSLTENNEFKQLLSFDSKLEDLDPKTLRNYRIQMPANGNFGAIYSTNKDQFFCLSEKRQLVAVGQIELPLPADRPESFGGLHVGMGKYFHGIGYVSPQAEANANCKHLFGFWNHGLFTDGIAIGSFGINCHWNYYIGFALNGTFKGSWTPTGKLNNGVLTLRQVVAQNELVARELTRQLQRGAKLTIKNGSIVKFENSSVTILNARPSATQRPFFQHVIHTTREEEIGFFQYGEFSGGKVTRYLICRHVAAAVYYPGILTRDEQNFFLQHPFALCESNLHGEYGKVFDFPGCAECCVQKFKIILNKNFQQVITNLDDQQLTVNLHGNMVEGFIQNDGKLDTVFIKTEKELTVNPQFLGKLGSDEKFATNRLQLLCGHLAVYRDIAVENYQIQLVVPVDTMYMLSRK